MLKQGNLPASPIDRESNGMDTSQCIVIDDFVAPEALVEEPATPLKVEVMMESMRKELVSKLDTRTAQVI